MFVFAYESCLHMIRFSFIHWEEFTVRRFEWVMLMKSFPIDPLFIRQFITKTT